MQDQHKELALKDNLNKYIILHEAIEKGTFGTVYKGSYICEYFQEDNSKHEEEIQVAIKSVFIDPRYKFRQSEIVNQISHPNIVHTLHAFEDYELKVIEKHIVPSKPKNFKKNEKKFAYFVMEYVPTDLAHLIKKNKENGKAFNFKTAILILKQILSGLAYLHMLDICHRDLKTNNILLDENNLQNSIKICDFGSAKKIKGEQKNINYICSRFYRAPQLMLECKQYSNKIDMWSMGCIFMQMLSNKPIFNGKNAVDQCAKIMNIIGLPTTQEIEDMHIKKQEIKIENQVFTPLGIRLWLGNNAKNIENEEEIELIANITEKLLVFSPKVRMSADQLLLYLKQLNL